MSDEDAGRPRRADPTDARPEEQPDMTRERARTERRDLDKERGEPVAGGIARGGPRALRSTTKPLHDWSTRPKILITNDDGVESRGLLALKQALDKIGDTTVVAPDTNQSAVGHQKTLMRPLRVRERTLGDGSLAYSVDGSPTDAVSLAFLGFFGHGFDLVAAGINYGANLGDDITYSGTVSAAMEAVINRRIAVTPIHLDLTGRSLLRRLKTWSWSLEPTAGQIGKEAAKPPGRDRPEAAAAEDELTDEGKTERR